MHFHALPHHHSYLIYAFEKPPSTSSTGAFQAPHITGIPFTNISYFLKTKRCSCAMRRKLYFTLFIFQKPVARQLCWVFTMSSFSVTSDSRIIHFERSEKSCISFYPPHICCHSERIARDLVFYTGVRCWVSAVGCQVSGNSPSKISRESGVSSLPAGKGRSGVNSPFRESCQMPVVRKQPIKREARS